MWHTAGSEFLGHRVAIEIDGVVRAGEVRSWLPASESNFLDDKNRPAPLWRVEFGMHITPQVGLFCMWLNVGRKLLLQHMARKLAARGLSAGVPHWQVSSSAQAASGVQARACAHGCSWVRVGV